MLKELIEEANNTNLYTFLRLVRDSKEIIRNERDYGMKNARINNALVEIDSNDMIVIGDIHGDFDALVRILIDSDPFTSDTIFVFLGDYGDRGLKSVEVYHLILSLKVKLGNRIILLRGNHEYPNLPFMPYDMPSMLYNKFNDERAYNELKGLFDLLYNALINKKILMLHGGLPITLTSKLDLALADNDILEQILWNDPKDGLKGFIPSFRGYGYFFGKDITLNAINLLNCSRVIRSHEACNGYKTNHDGLILTIFSCKEPYGNRYASYIKIDEPNEDIINKIKIF
ncbi:MAG: metallophosphoesterase [Candidatus Nitrosocaldaceae archaeon]